MASIRCDLMLIPLRRHGDTEKPNYLSKPSSIGFCKIIDFPPRLRIPVVRKAKLGRHPEPALDTKELSPERYNNVCESSFLCSSSSPLCCRLGLS